MQNISASNLTEYSAENYVNISAKLRKTYTGVFVDFSCEAFAECLRSICRKFAADFYRIFLYNFPAAVPLENIIKILCRIFLQKLGKLTQEFL